MLLAVHTPYSMAFFLLCVSSSHHLWFLFYLLMHPINQFIITGKQEIFSSETKVFKNRLTYILYIYRYTVCVVIVLVLQSNVPAFIHAEE